LVIAQSQVFALQFDKTKRLFGCTFSSLDVELEAASATPFTLPDIPIVARASATKPLDKVRLEFRSLLDRFFVVLTHSHYRMMSNSMTLVGKNILMKTL
jgi:hypothetical protein